MASSSLWNIIRPEETINLCTNPSFETNNTGWTVDGSNTLAISTDVAHNGAYSGKCTYQDNVTLALYSVTLTAEKYSFSVYVNIPSDWDGGNILLTADSFTSSTQGTIPTTASATLNQGWYRLELIDVLPDAGDLSGFLRVYTDSAPTAGKFIYIDSVQIEQKDGYVTTYADGTFGDGYKWLGTPHASKSKRDQFQANGGRVLNFADNIGYIISGQDGTGMVSVNNLSSPLAMEAGELFDNQTINARQFTLIGSIVGSTKEDFHSKKKTLLSALNPKTKKINEKAQQRTLTYTGATTEKYIQAVYDGGLEAGLPSGFTEMDYKMRLKADNPIFYATKENTESLSEITSATFRTMAGRVDGIWTNFDLDALGTYTATYAMVEYENALYVGGNLQNIDNIASADYIAKYDLESESWSALGSGLNGQVNDIAVDADGNIWVVGNFTTAGGSTANGIAMWNGSSWDVSSAPSTAQGISSIAIGDDGYAYIGGLNTNYDGIANADYCAYWDGSSWNAMGTGMNALVNVVRKGRDGYIYFGGNFTTSNSVTTNQITYWNGTTFVALDSGLATSGVGVQSIDFQEDNTILAGGAFTIANGAVDDYFAFFRNGVWNGYGTVLNDKVTSMIWDGEYVYFGGTFTTLTNSLITNGLVAWNGFVWFPLEWVQTSVTNYSLSVGESGNLYIGSTQNATATYPDATTITYTGTENAYPVITITRSGGTTATLKEITNNTTGASLFFNYSLADGETITVDTRPLTRRIKSTFNGDIPNALLQGSNFGQFYLMAGNSGSLDNIITMSLTSTGTPTITANIKWQNAYVSEDD